MADSYSKTIKRFSEQFSYEPEVKNPDKLERKERVIIAGMGGSRLAGDILRMWKPEKEIVVHSDYGLPPVSGKHLGDSLIIANSFSGNTEETVDAALKAIELGLSLAIVATGGKLIDIAKENGIPYVQFSANDLQPRMALGYSLMSLLKVMGDEGGLNEAALLRPTERDGLEEEGKSLAETLENKIPVIYTSERNMELGYIWKVILNETAKVPAFCNRFPELNHNEIAAFSGPELPRNFFHFIFLEDIDDDERIAMRMEKLGGLYKQRDLPVSKLILKGESHLKKIFRSIILAHWTSYHLAEYYEVDPERTDIIEEFKKALS